MNWGFKIVLGLGAFMLFIVGAGIYMVSQDTDTLLDDDYYEKGLHYDEIYARKQSLEDHQAKPVFRIEQDTLTILFATLTNKGVLNFKRPSDGNLDKTIPFFTKTKTFKIPISSFKNGSWLVEIQWESQGHQYLDTQSVNF